MIWPALLSVLGALALGVGWILQHWVVDGVDRGFAELLRTPLWWAGIAAMSAGQTFSGIALQNGPITLVAPLLSTDLLVAFLLRAALVRHRPPRSDIVGALGVAAAVIGFVLIGGPHVTPGHEPVGLWASTLGTVIVAGLALVLVTAGIKRGEAVVSITSAMAAGLLYGLQDVATRACLIMLRRHPAALLLATVWPYLFAGTAVASVLLTQRAFRAERLDYALPPIAATQSVVGVILGVALIGDHLDLAIPALAVEAGCLALLVLSAALLSRSAAFASRAEAR